MPRSSSTTALCPTVLLILAVLLGSQGSSVAEGPVKVFILSGQSNMEGKASVTTLEAVIADSRTRDEFAHLKKDGEWAVRSDVWATFLDRRSRRAVDPVHGPLSVGFGSPKEERDSNGKRVTVPSIGPELGIGHVLGDHFEEQVLLIKAAWGGRAVKYSFRPPGAMPTDEQIEEEVAAIRSRRPDREVTFESYKAGYGSDYRKILAETRRVLDNLETYFPRYDDSQGYEIAGCIWFQGWNDGVGSGNPDYVQQMVHFIRDLRRDLEKPSLPFVIGELGIDGPEATGWIAEFREQQAAIAAAPEFQGNVRLAKTAHCWPSDLPDLQAAWKEFRAGARKNEDRPKDDPGRIDPGEYYRKHWVQRYRKELSYTSDRRYHYLGSGACYYRMGRSMGKAMLELLD